MKFALENCPLKEIKYISSYSGIYGIDREYQSIRLHLESDTVYSLQGYFRPFPSTNHSALKSSRHDCIMSKYNGPVFISHTDDVSGRGKNKTWRRREGVKSYFSLYSE